MSQAWKPLLSIHWLAVSHMSTTAREASHVCPCVQERLLVHLYDSTLVQIIGSLLPLIQIGKMEQ